MDCRGCRFRLCYTETCRVGAPNPFPSLGGSVAQGKQFVFRLVFRILDLVRTIYVDTPLCLECYNFGSGYVFEPQGEELPFEAFAQKHFDDFGIVPWVPTPEDTSPQEESTTLPPDSPPLELPKGTRRSSRRACPTDRYCPS